MVKLFKIVAGVLGTLVVLSLVGLMAISHLINPDTLKKQAQTWAHDKLDRELTIAGDLHWQAFPRPGVRINDVQLSNAKGFDAQPMAHAKQVQISLALLPLLHKRISLNHIEFNGLTLNLQKKPSGLANWTFATDARTQTTDPTPTAEQNSQQSAAPFSLQINRITLKNAALHVVDQRNQLTFNLDNIALKTSLLSPNQPITLQGHGQLSTPSSKLKPTLWVNGKLSFHPDQQLLSVKDFELTSQMPQQVYNPITLHTTGNIDFDKQTLHLKPYQLEFAKAVKITGYINGDQLFNNPAFSGQLETNTINLKSLLHTFNIAPQTQNKKALTSMAFRSSFKASTKAIQFPDLTATVDQHTLRGQATYQPQPNRLTANLQADTLDIDPYLPPAQHRKRSQLTKETVQHNTTAPSPLHIDGHLSLKQVTGQGVTLNNVQCDYDYQQQKLALTKLSAALFDGSMRGTLNLNFSKVGTVFALDQTLANIDLAKLLRHTLQSAPLSGRANIQATLNGNTSDLPNSVSGQMSLSASHGTLYGVDIDHQIARVVSHLSKQAISKADQHQSKYESIQTNLSIKKSLVNTQSMTIKLPRYRIKGHGTTNLRNQALNHALEIKALYPLDVKTPIGSTDLSLYDIPLQITGTINDPNPSLDFPKIIAMTVKKQAEQVIKKTIENQVTDKLQNIIKDKLPF